MRSREVLYLTPSTVTQVPTTVTQAPSTVAQLPGTLAQVPSTATQVLTTVTQALSIVTQAVMLSTCIREVPSLNPAGTPNTPRLSCLSTVLPGKLRDSN